mgnify:CR=1 FL=1
MYCWFKALTQKQKDAISAVDKDCQEKSKVSKQLIKALFDHAIPDVSVYENNKPLREYLLCVDVTGGWFKQDGNFDTKAWKTILKDGNLCDEKVDELIKKCLVQKETLEETSFHAFSCVYNDGV